MEQSFHRSKKRIQRLGEVFTPTDRAIEMLDLLDKDEEFWSDETQIFFEPCCGHGNIVLAIYNRRLQAIYNKAIKKQINNPHLYSIANALNTLWAIDIETTNIETSRERVLSLTIEFLENKTNCKDRLAMIGRYKKFFAHVVAAIRWHIHENEMLSALSSGLEAESKAGKTKAGDAWFKNNGHNQLDFSNTWAKFFIEKGRQNVTPIEFTEAKKAIASLFNQQLRIYAHFLFVTNAINPSTKDKEPWL